MVYNSGTADEASDAEKEIKDEELNITYLSNVGAWHGKGKRRKKKRVVELSYVR